MKEEQQILKQHFASFMTDEDFILWFFPRNKKEDDIKTKNRNNKIRGASMEICRMIKRFLKCSHPVRKVRKKGELKECYEIVISTDKNKRMKTIEAWKTLESLMEGGEGE